MSITKLRDDFELPGYSRTRIEFQDKISKEISKFEFIISPSTMQEQRTNDIQLDKTMTGYFVSRSGRQPGNLSFSGYLLDTRKNRERLNFLEAFATKVEDAKNKYMETVTHFEQSVYIEGRKYLGLIQSMGLSKTSDKQFLYAVNISFMFFKDTQITETSNAGILDVQRKWGHNSSPGSFTGAPQTFNARDLLSHDNEEKRAVNNVTVNRSAQSNPNPPTVNYSSNPLTRTAMASSIYNILNGDGGKF